MAVLNTTRWCHISSLILKECNVSYRAKYGLRYLTILIDNELITKKKAKKVRFKYFITNKGLKMLEDYKDLLTIFKELEKEF